jgi:signal transduction histidine kinase
MRTPPDPTAERFTMEELGRVFIGASQMRWIGVIILGTLASLYAAYDPSPLHVGLPLAVAAGLATLLFTERRRLRARGFQRRTVLYVVASLLATQATAIVLTGGIRSPVLFAVPPILVLTALGTGLARLYVLPAIGFIVFVWTLALGEVLGLWPSLLPPALGAGPITRCLAFAQAGVLSFAALAGGVLGVTIRAAFDRATTAAVRARAEAVEAMRERNRELVALSGALAHELKNPLAAIRGLAGIVARRLEPGSREAEQMGVLIGEVGRMAAVLDEFLNFSRPAAGLAARDLDAGALLDEVALVHEAVALERGVRFVRDVHVSGALRADPRKVKQVLVNLVQNALDASPPGGAVRLAAADRDGGGVVIDVLDDGPGLAAEVRGRLFTPGATTKAAGSGLGLTIARAIAEQHGGGLDLEARAEGGCRARLWLPATPPETPA